MTDAKQDIAVGQIWSGGLFGGNEMVVVAIEGDTIYVKRADSPKEKLRLGKGAAHPAHRSEFASMLPLYGRSADDERTRRRKERKRPDVPQN
ncbi:MAG TPA: hypothetical protein VLB89_04670 [Gaiellaceae bacterium]|nr:hypothetical protein [Gaiellaceae bacterium]